LLLYLKIQLISIFSALKNSHEAQRCPRVKLHHGEPLISGKEQRRICSSRIASQDLDSALAVLRRAL